MFEAATWRTENRKHFEVIEDIYVRSGCRLPVPEEPPGLDEQDLFAASLVHRIGSHLLRAVVDFASAKNQRTSIRRSTKAWKQITPGAGTAAAIYLTVALPTLLRPEFTPGRELAQEPIRLAESLVKETFDFPMDQWMGIESHCRIATEELRSDLMREAIDRDGLAAQFPVHLLRMKFSYTALELAGLDPRTMPGMSTATAFPMDRWNEIEGLEWFLTSTISAEVAWREHEDNFLECAFAPWVSEDA